MVINHYFKEKLKTKTKTILIHTRKKRTNEVQVSRWKEVSKVTVKINELGTKKLIEKDQWGQEIILWENKQDWQTFSLKFFNIRAKKIQILKTKNERQYVATNTT